MKYRHELLCTLMMFSPLTSRGGFPGEENDFAVALTPRCGSHGLQRKVAL
jgi:hypothetical protein